MKYLTYKLIKTNKLSTLEEKGKSLELQVAVAKNFIKEIEKGNLSIDLENKAVEDGDSLALSLISMRDQMKKIADEEKQRNWATEGLARFVDILRTKNDDLKELADIIISSIIKYMNANQGSLYVINEDDPANINLELIACYAYNRKKYLTQRIGLGEGLVGQAVLEKATVYMTNLPPDYLKISSGLGEALPRNLLIVPLIVNEKVYGVIEMASFNKFENHHREFIERLAESIASTISTVRINQHTRKLLAETQEQTEKMRGQEEEMRQNMEELTATQEGMQRVLKEMEGKEAYVNQLLNVSSDLIFTIDRNYKLVSWNRSFAASLERFGMRMEKGMNVMDWFPDEEAKKKQITMYNRVFIGEAFDDTAPSEINGTTYYFQSIHAPLKNELGEIYEAAVFTRDVTQMTIAQKKAEQMLLESQNQAEELRAQEEELRQNMEELQTTQEAIISKQAEVDRAREENERIKREEAERALKIGEMQKKTMLSATLKLKSKVGELEQMKLQMEKMKDEEAKRGLKVAEMQKQSMNKMAIRLKAAEEELKHLKGKTKI